MRKERGYRLVSIFMAVVYLIWGIVFIHHSSFIAIDGNRYYSLTDDAMISMRYAWNLSHGHGLVWNAGERVEGYSNLLMTLIMSLATLLFEKKDAVFVVQMLGIPTVLLSAFLSQKIALHLLCEKDNSHFIALVVFTLTLLYYPLSYWSLMGMESGLLTVLTLASVLLCLQWVNRESGSALVYSGCFLGMAFLTRNDALLMALIIFAYAIWGWWKERDPQRLRQLVAAVAVYGWFVIAHLMFRAIYYGDYLPNTYVLKLGQIPLSVRVNDGSVYIYRFLKETWFLMSLAGLGLVFVKNTWKWCLAGLLLITIMYQVWTGGDAWDRWRFILPSIPIAIVLGAAFLSLLGDASKRTAKLEATSALLRVSHLIYALSPGILLVGLLVSIMKPYWREISFRQTIPDYNLNQHNMDVAVAIEAVTTPDAQIGVFTAGLIPYYVDRHAIDFLGKSDEHIAGLYPNIPQSVNWFHRTTLPGHNKYDLNYSIRKLQPTYVQRFVWGVQNLRRYAIENYVKLEYQDSNGEITLMLKKDSPYVYWNKGIIIPWEK